MHGIAQAHKPSSYLEQNSSITILGDPVSRPATRPQHRRLGLTETQLGQLAVEKPTRPELKALGAQLVADHGKSNQDLIILAQKKGVDLKMGPTSAQKQMLASLRAALRR